MDLLAKIRTIPTLPGCYLYKNAEGEVIYVGKAKNLRARVRSYFLAAIQANAKTGSLMREAVDMDYITRRQRARGARARKQPHQAAQAALQHPAARRQDLPLHQAHARRPLSQGLRHAPAAQGRQRLLRPLLPRQPRPPPGRPHPPQLPHPQLQGRSLRYHPRACLQYYIKRCLGPCVEGLTTPEAYEQTIRDVQLFLDGKPSELEAA